jgi:prolyl-tRNA synthetase
VTRLSGYLLPTLRDDPADSESISHRLLVRAGMVRQLGAGLWTWLPAGLRVVQRVQQVIREEMNAIGGQELLIPLLQPASLWEKTGRYGIDELMKLDDRKGSPHVLAMTHEEGIAFHMAREVRSYRDLPLLVYQLQLKERDEPRPRAGVLRTREFTMKDAYSLDRDSDGLDRQYELNRTAYSRIFERCGLDFYEVAADVGMMGGTGAHEYMAPCPAGENDVALAPGYAANVEVASAEPQPVELPPALDEPREVPTPGLTTVADVSSALGVGPGALIKAVPVVAPERGLVMVLVRGDHRLNEVKLRIALGEDFRQASAEEIGERIGPAGFIGPVGAGVPVVKDTAITGPGLVCGANSPDAHLIGVEPGRDFSFEEMDVRSVEAGDSVAGGEIRIEPAIEVGNIFKLGTRYSEALGATFLDESGAEHPIVMGSYGIGPARIVAAAVEQGADDKGIVWPAALTPWQVELIGLGRGDDETTQTADRIYDELRSAGLDVLYDDREAGAGEKLTDAELIGCPVRVVAGKRALAEGQVEAQVRVSGEDLRIDLGEVASAVRALTEPRLDD